MRCGNTKHSCTFLRAAICGGDQGKFWQMDSWLFAHAPGSNLAVDLAAAARDIGLDQAELERCWTAPETIERAAELAAEARALEIRETPTYVVDDEKLGPKEMAELLDDRL
jgi:protein-disulfide isomerase